MQERTTDSFCVPGNILLENFATGLAGYSAFPALLETHKSAYSPVTFVTLAARF